MTTHISTWASNYDAQVQLSTKQQVIGCVQGTIRLQGISRVRKLEQRNTDSNRSTGGNKYYKSKIGRKGKMLAWKTLPKVHPKVGSTLASTHRPNPWRSKALEETSDAIFNTTVEDRAWCMYDVCHDKDAMRLGHIKRNRVPTINYMVIVVLYTRNFNVILTRQKNDICYLYEVKWNREI
jgi:hypothetical protein